MRTRREELGWSQEKVGVLIGLDESSSRARISRYELGVHEPPVAIARLIADALGVPLPYLYCDDDDVAALLLAIFDLPKGARRDKARAFLKVLLRAG
jgi:transcriptional regulator with XRE-family HTH domain